MAIKKNNLRVSDLAPYNCPLELPICSYREEEQSHSFISKEDAFTINCFGPGYDAYMDIWAPKTGDSDFEVTLEEENERDKFKVAIYHDILSVFVIAKLFHQL